jgi:hypothetical protein
VSDLSLRSEVEFVLSNTGQRWEAAAALISDFLRVLHELMFKSGRDQAGVMAQVQAVFGASTMHHLARILNAQTGNLRRYDLADDAPLYERLALIFRQRGFELDDGLHFLAHFVKALDEERTDIAGNIESAAVMLYWGISHEAAYHLGGLYVGDSADESAIELCGYLDPQLRRFHKLVEIWELEAGWDRENAE